MPVLWNMYSGATFAHPWLSETLNYKMQVYRSLRDQQKHMILDLWLSINSFRRNITKRLIIYMYFVDLRKTNSFPSIGWRVDMVGWLVGRSVCHNFLSYTSMLQSRHLLFHIHMMYLFYGLPMTFCYCLVRIH